MGSGGQTRGVLALLAPQGVSDRTNSLPVISPHPCRLPLTAMCSVDLAMAATRFGNTSASRPGWGAGAWRSATSHSCSPSSSRLSSSGCPGSVHRRSTGRRSG